jgi:hypothetical protein
MHKPFVPHANPPPDSLYVTYSVYYVVGIYMYPGIWDRVETKPIIQPKRKRAKPSRPPLVTIEMKALKRAWELPGRIPLMLLLLARYRADTQGAGGSFPVTLPNSLLREWGIDAAAKSRGLKVLEQAGLLKVVREPGQTARLNLPKTRMKLKGEENGR